MVKLATATLLFLQATEAAFLPDSVLKSGKCSWVPLIEVIPGSDAQVSRQLITLAARDPFLNTPMPGSAKRRKEIYDRDEFISSRFERFDKRKYGDELLDSRLDDFINRKKPPSGRPEETFEESKFQRYDKDKDGDLLLKDRRSNDNAIRDTKSTGRVANKFQRSTRKYQPRNRTEPRSKEKGTLNGIPKEKLQTKGANNFDHKLKNLKPRSGASNLEDSFQRYDQKKHGDELGGTKSEEMYDTATCEDEDLGKSNKQDESQTGTRASLLEDSWPGDDIKSTNAIRRRAAAATRPGSRRNPKEPVGEFSKPSREKSKTRVIPIPKTQTPKFDMKSEAAVDRRSQQKSGSFKPPLEAGIYKSRPPQRNFRLQPNPLQNATILQTQRKQQVPHEHQPVPTTVSFPPSNARTAPTTPRPAKGEGSTLAVDEEYEDSYDDSTDLMERLYESALMDAVGDRAQEAKPRLAKGRQALASSEDSMQDALESDTMELEALYESALMDAVGHRAQEVKSHLAKGQQMMASSEESMQDAFESNIMELMAPATDDSKLQTPPAGGWDDFIQPPPRSDDHHDYSTPMPGGHIYATNGDDEESILELQRQIKELKEMVRMTPTSKEGGKMRESESRGYDDDDDEESFANAVAYETLSPKLRYDLLEEELRWDAGFSDAEEDDMPEQDIASTTAYIHEAQGYEASSSREAEWLSHPSMGSFASEFEEQADDESDGLKAKAPGFVGFSGIDWSDGRMG